MKRTALIVAGGSGSRMGSRVPKQFLLLANRPVLCHTLEKFRQSDESMDIILVLPKQHISSWKELCKIYKFKLDHEVVEGGETRFHSVQKGIATIQEECVVAVHDGVRPLVSAELITKLMNEAEQKGNAVPAIPVPDSMRSVSGEKNFFADRSSYRLIQTPQCFHSAILQNAFKQEYAVAFTDEANVVESSGVAIHLVDGESSNIKITTSNDMLVAEALLKKQK